MQDGLRELTSRNSVCTKTLRTLTGIWIWGAQLRRELLSIPHALFRFLDRFPEKIVAWWPSVRREVQAMATAIAAMAADVGAPLAPIVFASDAQGAGEGDDGGYRVVAKDVPMEVAERCFQVGRRPGYSVTKLSGEFAGSRRPGLMIARNIPFTRLPRELFDDSLGDWEVISRGRWLFANHITLGEARAINKIIEMVANCGGAHRRKIISLEDNLAAAGAYAKGRSPAPALNFLLRKRAAWCVAGRLQLLLPWTVTTLMPADEASRLQSILRAPPPGSTPGGEGQGIDA